jgi:uncharacterized protein YndB with AHSA1/START domain/predicted enzyme related to lactoylglutathione lyase
MQKKRIIHLSLESVWTLWTTHDGLKSFFGSDNKVELRIGGAYEIYFSMQSPEGLRGSEDCKILSYLPNEMLSFSWNVPPEFEALRQAKEKNWVVVTFKTIGESQTEVALTHLGWQDTAEWQAVHAYFDKAWDYVLDKMMLLQSENIAPKPEKVTGLGGIFFKSKNPAALKEWYASHLGLTLNPYGATFEWCKTNDTTQKNYTQWSPFAADTKYFEPATTDFMLNYTVADLEALLVDLRQANITILDEIETYDFGKFLHILDIEGNKVELWEPM